MQCCLGLVLEYFTKIYRSVVFEFYSWRPLQTYNTHVSKKLLLLSSKRVLIKFQKDERSQKSSFGEFQESSTKLQKGSFKRRFQRVS